MRILEKRAYAEAKSIVERPGQKLDDLPSSPMIAMVQEIQSELMLEAWQRRQQLRR